MERETEFIEITEELVELFNRKNQAYGDDFFSGGYSPLERWLSIRRKVARLSSHYEQNKDITLDDEHLEDTWKDLANYAIMELMLLKKQKEVNNNGKKGSVKKDI